MTVDELIIRMRTVGGKQAAGDIAESEAAMHGVGRAAKFAAGVAGLGALTFGLADVTRTAIRFQQQSNQLQGALKATGQYSADNMKRLTEFADTLSTHGGFDPGTTVAGLQRLIVAHDSVTKSMKDEMLVQDIARRTGMSYNTALRAVMIVEQGRTTGLARLGIVIPKVNTAQQRLSDTYAKASLKLAEYGKAHKLTTDQMARLRLALTEKHAKMLQDAKDSDLASQKTEALRTLWHRFGGSVQDYSHGAAGAISNFRNAIDVLFQKLGKTLLPAITALARLLASLLTLIPKIVAWFVKEKTLFEAVGIAIGIVAAAYIAMNAAAIAAAAGTAILSGAMVVLMAIPIVAAFAALVAVVYLVITHFKDLKKWALDAFHWILNAAQDVWKWIKQNWPLLAAILLAPMTFGISIIVALFHKQLLGAIKDVWNWIKTAWGNLGGILAFPFKWMWDNVVKPTIGYVWGTLKDVWNWIKGAWQTLGNAMAAPFKWAWDNVIKPIFDSVKWLLNAINNLNPFSGPSHLPTGSHAPTKTQPTGLGLGQQGRPAIRGGRQHGGPIFDQGWYLVGERRPELVELPARSFVHPSADLAHAGRQELGSGNTYIFEGEVPVNIDGRLAGKALVRSGLHLKALQ